MRKLNGSDLAAYIKQRHARSVRQLKAGRIVPRLAIIKTKNDPAINTYVKLKKRYGEDIGAEVEVHAVDQANISELIEHLNKDDRVHGIIVQLPLEVPVQTDTIVNQVAPKKDVDGLGKSSEYEPATPTAILWLLNGYNIELKGKKILLVGKGKLVGAPLELILKASDLDVSVVERENKNLGDIVREADILISATGNPGIIKPEFIKDKAVVVDAGVASEAGKTVGDLDPEVYTRDDLTITPQKGGVGPLTVCALFENLIRAAG